MKLITKTLEQIKAHGNGSPFGVCKPLDFYGVTVSVQASSTHYSLPRVDYAPNGVTHVELGFPSVVPPDYIMEYAEEPDAPTNTVYGYVPIELVEQWRVECFEQWQKDNN